MYAGDCFVLKTGSDGYHLWVVLSDPFQNSTEVLVVNFTGAYGGPYEDLSCVCNVGDHPWITKQSYVAYDMARVFSDTHLDRLVTSKAAKPQDRCSDALLERIRAAPMTSPDLENRYAQMLLDQGLV